MENSLRYSTQTYNPIKAFICGLLFYGILTISCILIFKSINMPTIGVLVWILLMIIPFFFQQKYKMLFTRNIELIFNDTEFKVQSFKNNGNILLILNTEWRELSGYRVSFTQSGFCELHLYLKSGQRKYLLVAEASTEQNRLNTRNAFTIFYYFIIQHSKHHNPEYNIEFRNGFLSTKKGAFILYIISLFAVCATILHFVLFPHAFPFSFAGFFIILGLLVKRKSDQRFKEKINQLAPLSYNDIFLKSFF